jgi:hypothetical protein
MPVRGVEFDEDGIPFPVLRQPVTPKRMISLLAAALAAPYVPFNSPDGGIDDDEMQFLGLTNGEVGALKAARNYARGDLESAKFVHDRLIGKAKQQIETTNMNLTFQDYLSELNRQEEAREAHRQAMGTADAIEVKVISVQPDFSQGSKIKVPQKDYSALKGI